MRKNHEYSDNVKDLMGDFDDVTAELLESLAAEFPDDYGPGEFDEINRPFDTDTKEVAQWKDINQLAKTHPAVKQQLDQLILIYNLSKEDHNEDTE
jgi:hypothetical protein